jgi:hypothetical protein
VLPGQRADLPGAVGVRRARQPPALHDERGVPLRVPRLRDRRRGGAGDMPRSDGRRGSRRRRGSSGRGLGRLTEHA